MIIGIDIDDTIAKTNISLLEEAFQYDKDHCGGRGFKNKDAYALKDMFKDTIQTMMNAEFDSSMGYEKSDNKIEKSNYRNGSY